MVPRRYHLMLGNLTHDDSQWYCYLALFQIARGSLIAPADAPKSGGFCRNVESREQY